ncbi:MAG: beta-lactamase family protein [Deltaproteobacteria bacterium]|nr:beta-lactamase family protein [Deltaproteobacteria bacterium]
MKTSILTMFLVPTLLGCAPSKPLAPMNGPQRAAQATDPALARIHNLASTEANKQALPGMAVGLIRAGKLVSVKGYGASPAAKGITGETVFRLGSVTKTFTAMAVLQLRDAGKLKLADPVAKYLPELAAVLSPAGKKPVSVQHLLRHSSGIPPLGDGSIDWTRGVAITEAQLLASVKNTKLRFEPGTQMEYSNVAMALAGLVVARASGTSYRAHIERHIIDPLQMSATRWQQKGYARGRVFPGYLRVGGEFKRPKNTWVLGAIEPAGGLYSTVHDMAKFLAFQLNPHSMSNVLSAKSVAASHDKAETPASSPMGLGWVVEEGPELKKIVWHNGATYAYCAWVGIDPIRKNGAIIFFSTGGLKGVAHAGRLGKDALKILAGFEPGQMSKKQSSQNTSDAKLIAAIGPRMLALINHPKEAKVAEIFSKVFLKQLPETQVHAFLQALNTKIGLCTRYELVEDKGRGRLKLKLFCANAAIHVTLAAQSTMPYLLDGFLIKQAP